MDQTVVTITVCFPGHWQLGLKHCSAHGQFQPESGNARRAASNPKSTARGKEEVPSTSELIELAFEFQIFLITHITHAECRKKERIEQKDNNKNHLHPATQKALFLFVVNPLDNLFCIVCI